MDETRGDVTQPEPVMAQRDPSLAPRMRAWPIEARRAMKAAYLLDPQRPWSEIAAEAGYPEIPDETIRTWVKRYGWKKTYERVQLEEDEEAIKRVKLQRGRLRARFAKTWDHIFTRLIERIRYLDRKAENWDPENLREIAETLGKIQDAAFRASGITDRRLEISGNAKTDEEDAIYAQALAAGPDAARRLVRGLLGGNDDAEEDPADGDGEPRGDGATNGRDFASWAGGPPSAEGRAGEVGEEGASGTETPA